MTTETVDGVESDDAAPDSAASTVTVLDNRRTPCAIGLIRANEVMASVPVGGVLEILTRDHFASAEIPLWARRAGHSTPAVSRAGSWPRRYWIYSVVAGGAAS